MAAIAATKKEWTACLSKSNGAPGKCEKLEKELSSMSKAAGVECCVGETVNLMRCTASGARAHGCSAEFVAMRECNRAGGKELVKELNGGYAVAPGKVGLFGCSASALVSETPPTRSLQGMTSFGEEYAKSFGIALGEVRF
mmetsp:Transcript_180470/g.572665  ORF Transcript_180470/g.572665 Transcript_180470/m.572665 type:complete len:141 (+) Transcript_180470:150-572(+)